MYGFVRRDSDINLDEQTFTCFFVSLFFDEQAAVLGTIEGLAISVFYLIN